MSQITAHVHRGPLSRRVMLAGPPTTSREPSWPATMETVPGVSSARWEPAGGGVPLIAEAGFAVLGFLFGLLLAYLIELHRRYNAQWNW